MYIIIYTKEVWRDLDVDGVKKGLYEISNYGKIKNKKRNKILSANKYKEGYYRLILQTGNPNKPEAMFSVHRLVALTFIPNNDPLKNQVNHKNGDKGDNFEGNLEWVTHAENIQHAVKNKLHWQYVGENHMNSKYSNEFVLYVDLMIHKNMSKDKMLKNIKKKYPQYYTDDRKKMLTFIGRIRRHERYGKVLDAKGSTTIKRNID